MRCLPSLGLVWVLVLCTGQPYLTYGGFALLLLWVFKTQWVRSCFPIFQWECCLYSHGDRLCVQTLHCPPSHASNMEITQLFRSCCVFCLEKLEEEEAAPCVRGAVLALCCAPQPGGMNRGDGHVCQ